MAHPNNFNLGDAPGFLQNWWCVFWDLYCAAPERRDQSEYSSEAKAFHEYNSSAVPPNNGAQSQYINGIQHVSQCLILQHSYFDLITIHFGCQLDVTFRRTLQSTFSGSRFRRKIGSKLTLHFSRYPIPRIGGVTLYVFPLFLFTESEICEENLSTFSSIILVRHVLVTDWASVRFFIWNVLGFLISLEEKTSGKTLLTLDVFIYWKIVSLILKISSLVFCFLSFLCP